MRSGLRVLHSFFVPDLKALLVEPHLPSILGVDADSHELMPGNGEFAPVTSVAGPRREHQLSRVSARETTIPEPPLDELANQRLIHHHAHLLVSIHHVVDAVQTGTCWTRSRRKLPDGASAFWHRAAAGDCPRPAVTC